MFAFQKESFDVSATLSHDCSSFVLFSAFPLPSKTVKLKHFKVDLVTLPIKLLIKDTGKYRYFLQTDVGTPKNVLLSQM